MAGVSRSFALGLLPWRYCYHRAWSIFVPVRQDCAALRLGLEERKHQQRTWRCTEWRPRRVASRFGISREAAIRELIVAQRSMKTLATLLDAIILGLVLLAILIPWLNTENQATYARVAVYECGKLRVQVEKGDIAEAAASLKSAQAFWQPHNANPS
jgi:hypothetical protein